MNILKFIILVITFFNLSISLQAKIVIKYKINDEIITNMDIAQEKNYLIFLRPNIKGLSENEKIKISENSLITEIIKKREINKIFKEIDETRLIKEVKSQLFNYKNVDDEKDFIQLLNETGLEYDRIIKKMKYEALWNELVFQKYNSLIKINKNKLRSELIDKISNNKKYEYNISEILFEIEENESVDIKYKKIIEYINLNGFKSAAYKFSISNSSKGGGEIGWIKETLLSKKLSSILNTLNKFQITKPIRYPSGYLILRINDKKEMKQKIDIDKELNELINYEKNRQLNQFSILYYKKLKQNSKINEY